MTVSAARPGRPLDPSLGDIDAAIVRLLCDHEQLTTAAIVDALTPEPYTRVYPRLRRLELAGHLVGFAVPGINATWWRLPDPTAGLPPRHDAGAER